MAAAILGREDRALLAYGPAAASVCGKDYAQETVAGWAGLRSPMTAAVLGREDRALLADGPAVPSIRGASNTREIAGD
jgi:hypothetical protein